MKFKFTFEKLLQHRKREEELAMGEFLLARLKHDEAVTHLLEMHGAVTTTREQIGEIQRTGGATTERLRQLDEFIVGTDIRISRQKLEIRSLSHDVEEKQAVVVVRAQARKALEKLKEKWQARHRVAANKRSVKEMDDLVTMRFRQEDEER